MSSTSRTLLPNEDEVTVHKSRKREVMAGFALTLSILGFVLQTEVLGKVASLGYHKPMQVMYVTHSCMILLLPMQIIVLWLAKLFQRGEGLRTFYSKHTAHLRDTTFQVAKINGYSGSQLVKVFFVTGSALAVALNVAGASWYIAVNMTTTEDLTAIYNCSTFFAYGFSVLLLKEKLNMYKLGSVFLSVIGVFVIVYLGTSGNDDAEVDPNSQEASDAPVVWKRRIMGNIIIASGTILYGLYEVLYKKIACPPQTVSARKQAAFANLVGSAIGVGTLILMWPVLIVLHFTGWESLEWPSNEVLGYLVLSVAGNVVFSGAFLVLMSLTSPVLGSVSSLLATCGVPLVNFLSWHQKINFAEIIGGILIIIAFGVMAWASADDFIEEED